MTNSEFSGRLKVAIVGGGIAGATLLHVLLKHDHLDIQIYESGPEFSERGAAIGISSNAQAALTEMDPALMQLLDSAGATRMSSTRIVIGSGEHAGDILMDMAKEKQSLVVHRAALLSELLKPVPRKVMHVNKKLVKIEDTLGRDGVMLTFEDGSQEYADAVIGADGIWGYTRKYVLGDDPVFNASFAGFWDCRFLVPIQRAREALGEQYFTENRQYGWLGEGGFFMHDVLDNGESVQCVSSAVASTWGADEWNRVLDQKTMDEGFAAWTNSPIAPGMIKLLLENPDLRAYPQWHHKTHAPTFANHKVCIIGDAAHAMTPWQGSGAGQAIEDVMILSALFGQIEKASDIAAAFSAFDHVRRPRSQRIVDSSVKTGQIMCGKDPSVGLDPQKIREAIGPRWGFIFGINMRDYQREALEKFKAGKS